MQLRGIHTETLGHYLSALGLLRVLAASQTWRPVRGYWKQGFFNLASDHDGLSQAMLSQYLLEEWKPTPFQRWWEKEQKASKKDSMAVPRLRSRVSDDQADLLDAVMIQAGQRVFGELFGSGGTVGRRNLATIWKTCWQCTRSKEGSSWLGYTLFGDETIDLPQIASAGTWFLFANKSFNSGQAWFRSGRLSPWSFLLALEGAGLFRGSIHRRLGTRARGKAVFPFLCRAQAPLSSGEVGHAKSELWAPLWQNPATLPEVEAVFRTGLMEVDGRPASAPHEFAAAALGAGVDAGISAFARFEFRQTTSTRMFEAVPCNPVAVASTAAGGASHLIRPLIHSGWLDRLPREPLDSKQKGKFKGVRGPVERAILHLAEEPDAPARWRALLGQLARAQQCLDRNKPWRERCLPVPGLNQRWLDGAWPRPPAEIRVARAIASIQACPQPGRSFTPSPILVNVFGVEVSKNGRRFFPNARPKRVVWHEGRTTRAMVDLLLRRLIDAEDNAPPPLYARQPCGLGEVARFLAGGSHFDNALLSEWLPALTLIEWGTSVGRIEDSAEDWHLPLSPLYTLLCPLFFPEIAKTDGEFLFDLDAFNSSRLQATALRRIVQLLLQNQVDEVVAYARGRYLGSGLRVFDPPKSELRVDAERLVAALLIPVDPAGVLRRFQRQWFITPVLQPVRERIHV